MALRSLVVHTHFRQALRKEAEEGEAGPCGVVQEYSEHALVEAKVNKVNQKVENLRKKLKEKEARRRASSMVSNLCLVERL